MHGKEDVDVAVATRHNAGPAASASYLIQQYGLGGELKDARARELADEVINDAGSEQARLQESPPMVMAQMFGHN